MGWRHDQRGNYVFIDRRTGAQLERSVRSGTSNRAVLRMSVSGVQALINQLVSLRVSIKPILRRCARRSSTPVVKSVRSMLPGRGKRVLHDGKRTVVYGRTGQLRKSIAARVLTSKAGTIHAVVGARRRFISYAFKAYHKPNRNTPAKRNTLVRVRPSLYMHLVESGFTAKLWGSGKTRPVSGKFALKRSLAQNMANIQAITAQVLREKIDQVLNSGQPVKESAA